MNIHDTIAELTARLPELEWKLDAIAANLSPLTIPRGVFRTQLDQLTAQVCIDEIKADLLLLQHHNVTTMQYLSTRIQEKINVLVGLYKYQTNKPKSKKAAEFSVSMLGTRQQRLQAHELEINKLTTQSQALTARLQTLPANCLSQLRLNIQAELGELQQQLTKAQENFERATNLGTNW